VALYVCRGYKEEELSTYMEGLHAYNEMKDIGQMLLGRLGTSPVNCHM